MSWQTIPFHKFIALQRGFDLPRSKMKDGDVPVLGSNCIIGYHNEAKVDGPGVVTGRSGTLGLVQYAKVPYWPHNTALWVKDFKDNDPKFVYYKLETLNLERFNGGVSVPTLNRNVLDTLKVKIPDQKIQRRVVSILSAYDDLLQNNRRRIQLLEQAAQFLYKEWFVHFRFPGHEHAKITDGVPEKWRKISLGELCRLRAGDTFKPKYQGRLEGNLPFIKVRDLSREGNAIAITGADNWVTLDECEEFRGKPFSQGTSVFAKIGEGLRQNRVRLIVRDTLIDNNMMGAIPDQRVTVSEYLYFLLRGHDLASYAGGAAVPFLSAKVLEGMDVFAPPMHLLLLFHDAVKPMFHQIVNLEQQSAAAVHVRDILLPRLMNGEIAI